MSPWKKKEISGFSWMIRYIMSKNVRMHLEKQYSNRIIGRERLFPWPVRSPDLTDISVGTLKDLFFQQKPTTRENMME